jgi:hypothetical protein
MTAQLVRCLIIPASLLMCSLAGAQEQRSGWDDAKPLPESEQQQITLSLIQRYPLLAASPGIKAASAPPADTPGVVGISVIYWPHAERRGIKEAFEALCQREYPKTTWTCDNVIIRRYLQLTSQDWEVRVKGDISAEAAMALIDGSRRDLRAGAAGGSAVPDTAILITPHTEGGYRITWGVPDGRGTLTMLAHLADGGSPENPEDWHAAVLSR